MSKLFAEDDEPSPPAHVDEGLLRNLEALDAALREPEGQRQSLHSSMEMHERNDDGLSSTLIIAIPDVFRS